MPEPEFLPQWYRRKRSGAPRRRALARLVVVGAMAGAAALAMSARRAPAEDAAPDPQSVGAQRRMAAKSGAALPVSATRALAVIEAAARGRVTVFSLSFRKHGAAILAELDCSAMDADQLDAFGRSLKDAGVLDVQVHAGAARAWAGAEAPDASGSGPTGRVTFLLSEGAR